MRKYVIWLIFSASVILVFMTGMFWIFFTIPVTLFALALLYYIGKSSWGHIKRYFMAKRGAANGNSITK